MLQKCLAEMCCYGCHRMRVRLHIHRFLYQRARLGRQTEESEVQRAWPLTLLLNMYVCSVLYNEHF